MRGQKEDREIWVGSREIWVGFRLHQAAVLAETWSRRERRLSSAPDLNCLVETHREVFERKLNK